MAAELPAAQAAWAERTLRSGNGLVKALPILGAAVALFVSGCGGDASAAPHLAFGWGGQGSPTVVLEGGAFSGIEAWKRVEPGVAGSTLVCSYDRAGIGQSPPVAGVRT